MTVILIIKNRYDLFGFASLKIRIKAELTAKLFRDYFSGSLTGKITKNGEFQHDITFNCQEAFGKFTRHS